MAIPSLNLKSASGFTLLDAYAPEGTSPLLLTAGLQARRALLSRISAATPTP